MTFRFAKSEHLAIVADEHHAVSRVDGPRTEITLLDTHVEPAWDPTKQTSLLDVDEFEFFRRAMVIVSLCGVRLR